MLRSEVSHSLDHHSSHCHYYLLPEQDALVKIAKKLKKNNVAVDIVSFGCEVRPSSLSSIFCPCPVALLLLAVAGCALTDWHCQA